MLFHQVSRNLYHKCFHERFHKRFHQLFHKRFSQAFFTSGFHKRFSKANFTYVFHKRFSQAVFTRFSHACLLGWLTPSSHQNKANEILAAAKAYSSDAASLQVPTSAALQPKRSPQRDESEKTGVCYAMSLLD